MSLSSGLNAGVAGLSVNSTRLAVISDNIANANTNGYRRTDVDFSSLVTGGAAANSFSAGGVAVATFRDVASSGPLTTTNNSTDIAVAGSGLVPVTPITAVELPGSQRPFQMVATGSFRRNEDGYLVTTGGLVLQGWPTDATGNLLTSVARDSPTSLEPLRLSAFLTTASPTTEIELGVNLPAEDTSAGAVGTPIDGPIEYFDAIGIKHNLELVYTPTVPLTGTSNQWRLDINDTASGGALVASFDLTFDGSRTGQGSLLTAVPSATNPTDPQGVGTTASYNGTTGQATINVPDGPITIQLLSTASGTGMSQLAAPYTPNGLTKNGAPAGNLQSLEISREGVLAGVYDTGQRRALYQVPLGAVPNPNGLRAIDNQAFEISPTSGDVFFFDAGAGPAGELVGSALQQSTVDIAQELTDMIVTQRAFSSNATVIRTVDEMLQETTTLKR